VRQVSPKRRKLLAIRRAVVAQAIARCGGKCEAFYAWPLIKCAGPLDGHEVIPKSAWPGGWLVLDNVKMVCRRHHQEIDANPDHAHEFGFHGYSWERPGGHLGRDADGAA
jgi:hypothetical protein